MRSNIKQHQNIMPSLVMLYTALGYYSHAKHHVVTIVRIYFVVFQHIVTHSFRTAFTDLIINL